MKTYTIKQGENYCREWWRKGLLWKPRGMVAKVKFNSSILYESKFDGWQKIVGFSLGHHHDNSFRFVWRVVNGFFQIGAYQYVGKQRNEPRIIFSQKLIYEHPRLVYNSAKYGNILIKELTDYLTADFQETLKNHEFTLTCELMEDENLVSYRLDLMAPIYFISDLRNLPSIGYKLLPYYEQPKELDPTAPHDITFEMEVKYF